MKYHKELFERYREIMIVQRVQSEEVNNADGIFPRVIRRVIGCIFGRCTSKTFSWSTQYMSLPCYFHLQRHDIAHSRLRRLRLLPSPYKILFCRIHEGGRTESARVLRHARQIIYLNVSNPQRAKLCYAICHNIFASYSYCCSVFDTS